MTRYRAFDEENGIEVAWNKVKLRNVEEKAREQLLTEVKTLGKLDHRNIIHFYGSWSMTKEDSADVCINFITERCYSTLRECVATGAAVERCWQVAVRSLGAVPSTVLARPRSPILISPELPLMKMFSSLMSRWMTGGLRLCM